MLLNAGANVTSSKIEHAYRACEENIILCLFEHNKQLCNSRSLKYAVDYKMKKLFNFLIENNIKNDSITLNDILSMCDDNK